MAEMVSCYVWGSIYVDDVFDVMNNVMFLFVVLPDIS